MVADQLTDDRVHGVMDRGIILIYLLVSQKQLIMSFLEMIDVCPVGLTDKTFDLNLEYGSASLYNAHRNCPTCSGKLRLDVW
jgi:NADH-quinone oxidoreductase subunit G